MPVKRGGYMDFGDVLMEIHCTYSIFLFAYRDVLRILLAIVGGTGKGREVG